MRSRRSWNSPLPRAPSSGPGASAERGADEGRGIALDSEGNVLVAGSFTGSVDFGGGRAHERRRPRHLRRQVRPRRDAHLVAALRRLRQRRGAGHRRSTHRTTCTSPAPSPATVDFGLGPIAGAGGYDIFVARLRPGWNRRLGEGLRGHGKRPRARPRCRHAEQRAGDRRVHGDRQLRRRRPAVGGRHRRLPREADVDGEPRVVEAVRRRLGRHRRRGRDRRVGQRRRHRVTSTARSTLAAAGSTSAGSTDVFLAKFTSAGTHAWSKRFGSINPDRGGALAVAPNGDVVVGGEFQGSVTFGGARADERRRHGRLRGPLQLVRHVPLVARNQFHRGRRGARRSRSTLPARRS